MAEGRFLSKSIAHDGELNSVSLEADMLFCRCVPHLDREGRLTGHPREIKGKIVPLRDELTVEVIDGLLGELAAAGLVLWYQVEGKPALWFKGFISNNKYARLDREAESKLPSPNDPRAQRVTGFVRTNSDQLPTPPPEGKGREEKLREGKLREENSLVSEAAASRAAAAAAPGSCLAEARDLLGNGGAAALGELAPPGGVRAALAVIRTSLLYEAEDQGSAPEECVKGLPLGERRQLVARALGEMVAAGKRWSSATLSGFVRQLRTQPARAGPNGIRDPWAMKP